MLSWPIYYSLYLIAGMTLKLGDDLLDIIESPKLAWIPLSIAGMAFGILMTQTEWDLVLLVAIILGVLISGKVNRPQYCIGFFLIGAILWFYGPARITSFAEWIVVLIVLLISAAIDEWGNNKFETSSIKLVEVFFGYRFSLKLSALVIGLVFWNFLQTMIGLWLFDVAYELMGKSLRTISKHDGKQDYNIHQERQGPIRGS